MDRTSNIQHITDDDCVRRCRRQEIKCNDETKEDLSGIEHTAYVIRHSLMNPPTSSLKSKWRNKKDPNVWLHTLVY